MYLILQVHRGVSTYKCTGSPRLLQLDGSAP